MPNWCLNNLEVRSDDLTLINKFKLALNSEGLFHSLKPNPSGDWDYGWSVENWGTKWDVGSDVIQVIQMEDDRIIVEFDTAWGPPRGFLECLEELGFEVTCMYNESGMAFCGIYSNGQDDYYEYENMTPEEVSAMLPEELNTCFNISESIKDFQDG